jgi:hypothetical protein
VYLAQNGNWEQVAYLIERGADFLHTDEAHRNVPMLVQKSRTNPANLGFQKVKRLLIERGVKFPVPVPPPTHPAPKAQ